MKYTKICPICQLSYTTYKEKQITCSKLCMGINQSGKNNPNYGNLWSDKQKEHLSEHQKKIGSSISTRVKLDWKDNASRKQLAAETMSKTIKELYTRNPELWNKTHSEESKLLIGIKSKEKFTPDFITKQRQIMETLGFWRRLEEVSAYEKYYKEAEWVARMWDLVENSLLRTNGVFNPITNTNGCVRDHMFGRREGFRLNVPPILLRHPANCQILLNSENVKKARTNDVSQSLEDLIQAIQNYTTFWFEQEECIKTIKQYITN